MARRDITFVPFPVLSHPATLVLRHLAKSVPFDEIVANPSDLKHVGKLLGCSDGLGMVILTR